MVVTNILKSEDSVLDRHFPQLIHQHAMQRGDDNALIFHHAPTTWREFAADVNRIANRLLQLGIGGGGKAVLLGRNTASYVTAIAGIATAGAAAIPMPTMTTAEAVTLMLQDCDPDCVFVDEYTADLFINVLTEYPGLLTGVTIIALDFDSNQRLQALNALSLQSWLGDISSDYPAVELVASDPFLVMYSSGTTGNPKGIILSHGSRIAQATTMSSMGYAVSMVATPLYSLGGMSVWMPTIVSGGCLVVIDKFNEQEYLGCIEKYRVSNLLLVPIQYERLMAQPNFEHFDLSSICFKYGGSAPMTLAAKQELVARFPGEMLEFYSQTEGGVTTTLFMNHFPDKLDSVGQPTHCIIKIIDDDGNELPAGETGEIVGNNGQVRMEGYLNRGSNADIIWAAPDGEMFLRTGDLGFLDDDNFLYLRDRKNDMIITGGMNIYGTDIEAVLHTHEAIAETTVLGLASKKWGETPVALVVPKTGHSLAEGDLKQWSNERLSKSQRLARIIVQSEDLPKNHLGKVLKVKLREQLRETLGVLD